MCGIEILELPRNRKQQLKKGKHETSGFRAAINTFPCIVQTRCFPANTNSLHMNHNNVNNVIKEAMIQKTWFTYTKILTQPDTPFHQTEINQSK